MGADFGNQACAWAHDGPAGRGLLPLRPWATENAHNTRPSAPPHTHAPRLAPLTGAASLRSRCFATTCTRVQGDRYCGSVHPLTDTPCTHLVAGGWRYLLFPKLLSCCACCSAAAGCGVLSPRCVHVGVQIEVHVGGVYHHMYGACMMALP